VFGAIIIEHNDTTFLQQAPCCEDIPLDDTIEVRSIDVDKTEGP
jgi:hypothetical protein